MAFSEILEKKSPIHKTLQDLKNLEKEKYAEKKAITECFM